MGQIQQGINQLFTTAGFMTGLSPELRAKAEKQAKVAELERQTKDIKAAGEVIAQDVSSKLGTSRFMETAEPSLAIAKEGVSKAEELFRLDPTKERYQKVQKLKEIETSMESVMDQLKNKGTNKVQQKAQRRNFMKALGAEQVNFGAGAEGTVSELPKNLQKAIASSFSKTERKELMDKYYGSK